MSSFAITIQANNASVTDIIRQQAISVETQAIELAQQAISQNNNSSTTVIAPIAVTTNESNYISQPAKIISTTRTDYSWNSISIDLLERNKNWLPGNASSGPFFFDQNKILNLLINSSTKDYSCSQCGNTVLTSNNRMMEQTTLNDVLKNFLSDNQDDVHQVNAYFDINGNLITAIYEQCLP